MLEGLIRGQIRNRASYESVGPIGYSAHEWQGRVMCTERRNRSARGPGQQLGGLEGCLVGHLKTFLRYW